MNNILQNIILGISLAAPIGPASIAIIKNGIKNGFFSALKTAIGVILADTTYVLIVYLGISSFVTIPAVKTLIFTFGCLVLFYLGYQTIKEAGQKKELKENIKSVYKNQLIQGYVVNISNPIAVVWWLGVFGSILANSTQNENRIIALIYSLSIIVGILIWHTGLSVISSISKQFFSQRVLRCVSIISGIMLISYGFRFGYNAILSIYW